MEQIRLQAYSKKKKAPYEVVINDQHKRILQHIDRNGHLPDYRLVYDLHIQQAGARRCELRDAGIVEHYDDVISNGRTYASWSITPGEGRALMRRLFT